tara:strand:- start:631 stop:822 length:192 start_codon:yes stop_codon:yes gene_type:complete
MEMITGLISGMPGWLHIAITVLSACTVITAATPSQVDNQILNMVLKVLNTCAGNVGKNKNKDA